MIDWSQVHELKAEMDDAFDEVVTLFIEEADEIVARLNQMPEIVTNDSQTLAGDLHALKGAALNLGLRDFAARCSDGETLAQASDAVDLQVIIASYAASKAELLRGLGRFAA